MPRPRLAVFDFACCEGCQLQVANLEEEFVDLLSVVEPVEWREAMSERSDEFDIAVVEGSITRPADEERLKEVRARAGTLVAIGACATMGGVNRLKDAVGPEKAGELVYGEAASMTHLKTAATKAACEVVKVDHMVHGCPMDAAEFADAVRCLAVGKTPQVPVYPVCVECKKRGVVCRYEYGEICLGVVTRAGCGAPCPAAGFRCFGCRGFAEDPNVPAAQEVMDAYGKTVEDLRGKLELFNSGHRTGGHESSARQGGG